MVESAIFGIADPDLPIHCATFMGLRLCSLLSLLLSAFIVKHFLAKKTNVLNENWRGCGPGEHPKKFGTPTYFCNR